MNLNTELVPACRFDYNMQPLQRITLEDWICYVSDMYRLRVDTHEEADLIVGLAILEGKSYNYYPRIIVGPLPKFAKNILEVSNFND